MDAASAVALIVLIVALLVGLWWWYVRKRKTGSDDVMTGVSLPLAISAAYVQDGAMQMLSQATVGVGLCVALKDATDECPDGMEPMDATCCRYAIVQLAKGVSSYNENSTPPASVWTSMAMNMVAETMIQRMFPALNVSDRLGLERLAFIRKGTIRFDRLMRSRKLRDIKRNFRQLPNYDSLLTNDDLYDALIDDLVAEEHIKNSDTLTLDDAELESVKGRLKLVDDAELTDLIRRAGLEDEIAPTDYQNLRERLDDYDVGTRRSVVTRRTRFRRAMDWMENPLSEFVTLARKEMWDFSTYSMRLYRMIVATLADDGLSLMIRLIRVSIQLAKYLMKAIVKLLTMMVKALATLGLTLLMDGFWLIFESWDFTGKMAYVETGLLLEMRNRMELNQRISNYNAGRLVSLSYAGGTIDSLHAPVVEPFFQHWCTGGKLLSLANSTRDLVVSSRECLRTKASKLATPTERTEADSQLWKLLVDLVTTFVFPTSYMFAIPPEEFPSEAWERIAVVDRVLVSELDNKRNEAVKKIVDLLRDGDFKQLSRELRLSDEDDDETQTPAADQTTPNIVDFADGYEYEGKTYVYDYSRDYEHGTIEDLGTAENNPRWYELVDVDSSNGTRRSNVAYQMLPVYTQGYEDYHNSVGERLATAVGSVNTMLDRIWLDRNRMSNEQIAYEVFEQVKAYLKTCPAILTDEQRVQLLCWLRKKSEHGTVNVQQLFADTVDDVNYRVVLDLWTDQYAKIMQFPGQTEPEAVPLSTDLDSNNYQEVIVRFLWEQWKADVIDGGETSMSAFTNDLARLATTVDRTGEVRMAMSRVKAPITRVDMLRRPPVVEVEEDDTDDATMLLLYMVESITFTKQGVESLEQWADANLFTWRDFDCELAERAEIRPRMLWVDHYRSYTPQLYRVGMKGKDFYPNSEELLGEDKGTFNSGYGPTAGQTNAPTPVYHMVPGLLYMTMPVDALQTPMMTDSGQVSNPIVTSREMAQMSYTSELEMMCTRKPEKHNHIFAQWGTRSHKLTVFAVKIDDKDDQDFSNTYRRSGTHGFAAAKRWVITHMWSIYLELCQAEGEDTHTILQTTKLDLETMDHDTLTADDDGHTAYYRPFQEIAQFAKARFNIRFVVRYQPTDIASEVFAQNMALFKPPGVSFNRERAVCERTQSYCTGLGLGSSMQNYDEDGRFIDQYTAADGADETSGHAVLGGTKPQDCKQSAMDKVCEAIQDTSLYCVQLQFAEQGLYEGQKWADEQFNDSRRECEEDNDVGQCLLTGALAPVYGVMTGAKETYDFVSDLGIAGFTGMEMGAGILTDPDFLDKVKEFSEKNPWVKYVSPIVGIIEAAR
jgi:hypothetical protein